MLHKNLRNNSLTALAMLSAMTFSSASNAALAYSQNFETMNGDGSGDTLAGDGWLVGANVFDSTGTNLLYNYFAYPAPQGSGAFSDIAEGEGGVAQGDRQLSAYSDYANADHAAGNLIESNLFRDIGIITSDMVGQTYGFGFDAKQGNLTSPTTATAFMKVLDGGFNVIASSVLDTTTLGEGWSNLGASLLIDAGMVGNLMQVGFNNTATNYNGSANFYDNINVGDVSAVPVPAAVWLFGSGLLGLVGVARRRKS